MKEIKNILDLIPVIRLYDTWAQITVIVCFVIIAVVLVFAPRKTPPIQEESSPTIKIDKIDKSGDIVAGDKIVLPSADQDNEISKEKKQSIAKIKINRLLDDYQNNIDKLYQSYNKESNRIASEMSGRGLGRSGIHVKAQKDLAVETKDKNNESLTKLTRDIEDALLESYDSHKLEEIPELKKEYSTYTLLQEKTKQIYNKMVEDVKSWEVKSLGTTNLTKDFMLGL